MECCLCLTEQEYLECKNCKRVFCLLCIEAEEKENLKLLDKYNNCIYCRIQFKYLIKDCS